MGITLTGVNRDAAHMAGQPALITDVDRRAPVDLRPPLPNSLALPARVLVLPFCLPLEDSQEVFPIQYIYVLYKQELPRWHMRLYRPQETMVRQLHSE